MTLVQQYESAKLSLSNFRNIFLEKVFQPGQQDYTWVGGYPFPKNKPWGIFLYKLSEYFYGDLNYARLYVIHESGDHSEGVTTCLKIYQTYYDIIQNCEVIDDKIKWKGNIYDQTIDQIAMQQSQDCILKKIQFIQPVIQIFERDKERKGRGFTYPGFEVYTKFASDRHVFIEARNKLNYSIMQSGQYQEPSVLVQNVQVMIAKGANVENLDIKQIVNYNGK